MTTSQPNILDATETKVMLDAENYDVGGNFDNATLYRFTAPVAGYYFVAGAIRWNNCTAGKAYDMRVKKNASSIVLWDRRLPISGGTAIDCQPRTSDRLYLAQNDYLELWAWHNDGTNTPDITANEYSTYMTVWLIAT